MTPFETLFGIKESLVKNTCLLLPLMKKDILKWLGVKKFSRGRLYGSGNSPSLTVIHTGLGPALLGDAVLYLGQTKCQNIILFGSCGLIEEQKDIKIGSLVTPNISYSLESFSDMLSKDKKDWKHFQADKTLLESFLNAPKTKPIKKVSCATCGSLKLEKDYIDLFKENRIQAVDMESSALFSASKHIGKYAMALFYVTDIVNKKPFYREISAMDKLSLFSSIKSGAHILCEFIEKNLSC